MREIIFDTETTGFDPFEGDRIVEIGCVELINLLPTGRSFQVYVNPERDMPLDAYKVHGLSSEFLADKPTFPMIVQDFLDFVGADSRLIAHNASFDMRFINWELENAGLAPIPMSRVADTVSLARRLFPGMRVSLDNLCRRFNIDLSARTKHGALLDAELLAEVYLELKGGRQNRLELAPEKTAGAADLAAAARKARPQRRFPVSEEEKARHRAFLNKLNAPLWLKGGA